jgi:hypothetical protein
MVSLKVVQLNMSTITDGGTGTSSFSHFTLSVTTLLSSNSHETDVLRTIFILFPHYTPTSEVMTLPFNFSF